MKLINIGFALITAAAVLISSCGADTKTTSSEPDTETSMESSAEVSVMPRAVPEGETMVKSYGIVLSIDSGTLTVDVASLPDDAVEPFTEEMLVTTGVQKTINVDDSCPILDEDGNAISLTDIPLGSGVQFEETESLLISIKLLPEAVAETEAASSTAAEGQ